MTQLKLKTLPVSFLLLLASCGGGGSGSDSGSPGESGDPSRTAAGHWNHVSIDASGLDHSAAGAKENLGPTKSSRAMAIVHIAMFDAANAASGAPYNGYILNESAPGASVEAAISRSARDTLVALFPSQTATFEQDYQKDLTAIPDGDAKESGLDIGAKAAALILAERTGDGSSALDQGTPHEISNEVGHWRPDPLNPGQKPVGANWYKVAPFVIQNATLYRSPPPPALNSPAYAAAFNELLRLGGDGITTPTERTQDQTEAGIFWAYDGTPTLCAPPRLYNQIIMQLAADRGITDNLELTRLLALTNVAMADAGVTSWETKYFYDLWRPVTAIREADEGTGPTGAGDGNPLTVGDVNFTPLGAPASNLSANNSSPPFPAYVSGHATFGGALFQVLRRYFGTDKIGFTFVSDELNGVTLDNGGNVRPLRPRSFSSLSEAEEENGQSRIYLGIHFSFDKTEGIVMGNKVADYVFDHAFQPKN